MTTRGTHKYIKRYAIYFDVAISCKFKLTISNRMVMQDVNTENNQLLNTEINIIVNDGIYRLALLVYHLTNNDDTFTSSLNEKAMVMTGCP